MTWNSMMRLRTHTLAGYHFIEREGAELATIATTITATATGKCLTAKFHINIILKFLQKKLLFFVFLFLQLLLSWLYMFCMLWHLFSVTFYVPHGQRFIIIWFSSHFVSNLWFSVWVFCASPSRSLSFCILTVSICFCWRCRFCRFRAKPNRTEPNGARMVSLCWCWYDGKYPFNVSSA